MQFFNHTNFINNKEILYFGIFILISFIASLLLAIRASVEKNRVISQFIIYIIMYLFANLSVFFVSITLFIMNIIMLNEILQCLKFYQIKLNIKERKFQNLELKIILYGLLPLLPILYLLKIDPMKYLFIYAICFFIISISIATISKSVLEGSHKIFCCLLSFISISSISIFTILSNFKEGSKLILYIFFLTNICDIGALLFGKIFGKRKLIERLSPNKTIEGALGAVFVGIAFSVVICQILKIEIPIWHSLVLGLLIGIYSQIGDLFASLFKRLTGIKDYGKIIPGHGGILDRFDSLILTLPLFLIWQIVFYY